MIEDPLAALRPLHEPAPVSWWPPAPGWWIVLVLVVAFVVLVYSYMKRMAPRRAALHELKQLKTDRDKTAHPVAAVNQLLKRYALACWPVAEVASLTGKPWLAFLDANGGNGKFSGGPGQLLLTDSYQNEHVGSEELSELIALANHWIKINTPQKKQMFEFAWPWMFVCLVLPWVFRRFLPMVTGINQGVLFAPFIDTGQEKSITAVNRLQLRSMRTWGLFVCWFLLVVAAARPQWVGEETELPETGRNLMLAVDVSGSMEIADMGDGRTNRLEVVKQVAGDFIRRREGDRIGLILFGSEAYLQTPLTFDHNTVASLLQDTVIGIAGRETAIGDAIGMAIKHLKHLKHLQKDHEEAVLVLLTDGANNAGHVQPRKAAELAAQQGLRIYTIGVGGEPREMQSFFGMRMINPASDLDEETLKMIADLTGGQYFRATDRDTLQSIYGRLDQLEPTLKGSRVVRPTTELFIWPLGLGLIISFVLALRWWRAG